MPMAFSSNFNWTEKIPKDVPLGKYLDGREKLTENQLSVHWSRYICIIIHKILIGIVFIELFLKRCHERALLLKRGLVNRDILEETKPLIYELIYTSPFVSKSVHIASVPAKTNDVRCGLFWKLYSECKIIYDSTKQWNSLSCTLIFRFRTTNFSRRSRSLVRDTFNLYYSHIHKLLFVPLNTSISAYLRSIEFVSRRERLEWTIRPMFL